MAAETRRGLGRGLSALLGEASPARDGPAGGRETPIELVRPNPDQPRRVFAESELESLAQSIRERGVLQPVLVRPARGGGGEFQIVAGERRWRAAQRAGLATVPVIVRDVDDETALEIAIVENVQRSDLNPIEEAQAYRALMERHGRTQEDVAEAVGKSRSHVANVLRLLGLPDTVQAALEDGRLSAGHARALIGRPDAATLAALVIEKGLSVREAEALARQARAGQAGRGSGGGGSGRPGRTAKDADTVALESDLSETLGLEVKIDDRGGAGAVTIRYASLEQLDEICRRLSRSAL